MLSIITARGSVSRLAVPGTIAWPRSIARTVARTGTVGSGLRTVVPLLRAVWALLLLVYGLPWSEVAGLILGETVIGYDTAATGAVRTGTAVGIYVIIRVVRGRRLKMRWWRAADWGW